MMWRPILAALLLSGCAATSPRIVVQRVNVPVPVACPAAVDVPAKPEKPDLPDGLEAALRVAVAHAARLSASWDDLSGRLAACATVKP